VTKIVNIVLERTTQEPYEFRISAVEADTKEEIEAEFKPAAGFLMDGIYNNIDECLLILDRYLQIIDSGTSG